MKIKRTDFNRAALLLTAIVFLSACGQVNANREAVKDYSNTEPVWIRNGEPAEFEGVLWYPQDGTEIFLDSEVYSVGESRGVKLYVDKADVRPYNRIYTRFDKNKFRYFLKE